VNRDDLLQTVLGIDPDDYRPGAKIIEATDGQGWLVAHADIYWRRVVVMPPTISAGETIAMAATTLTVGRIANVCVDPAVRGEGWGRALMEACFEDALSHERVDFCAVLAEAEQGFFEHFGFRHPDGARDPRFLVYALREDVAWPEGRVEVAW
jgi:N-acetylglutamate synthase-like GNAT family acetyltransferase